MDSSNDIRELLATLRYKVSRWANIQARLSVAELVAQHFGRPLSRAVWLMKVLIMMPNGHARMSVASR